MNMARHLAWMMNPKLTEEQVMALIQRDCDETLAAVREMRAEIEAGVAEVRERHGKRAAQEYVLRAVPAMLELMLL